MKCVNIEIYPYYLQTHRQIDLVREITAISFHNFFFRFLIKCQEKHR